MPAGLILAAVLSVAILAVLVSLVARAVSLRRASQASSTAAIGTQDDDATSWSSRKTVMVGIGAFVILLMVVVAGWFALILRAFKDFTLF